MPENPKREQAYSGDEIGAILNQLRLKRIKATIELRHDGSGKDLFTFYFTKIPAANVALK